MMRKSTWITIVALAFLAGNCYAKNTNKSASFEEIRLGSWNIEHFMKMFDQDRMPERSQERSELWDDEEDQYEVARVMKHPAFNPDILVIQECSDEAMLKLFNEKWLEGVYSYIKVFKGNTDGQFLGIMAKPGFEAVQVKEYYLDDDPVKDNRISYAKRSYNKEGENKLFCRGPGFVLFKTPGGEHIWVGTTHSKSKSGNSKAVTEWRIREYERTRQICGELIKAGPTKNLIIAGDFNDNFGLDSHEQSVGTDAIETMVQGTGHEKLICVNIPLLEKDPKLATYHCEIKPKKYRSFIDHAFVSPNLVSALKNVTVIQESIAYVASDHLPLLCIFHLPAE